MGALIDSPKWRGQWSGKCESYEEAFRTPEGAVRYVLAEAEAPLKLGELAKESMLSGAAATEVLSGLVEAGEVAALPGGHYALSSSVAAVAAELCPNPQYLAWLQAETA